MELRTGGIRPNKGNKEDEYFKTLVQSNTCVKASSRRRYSDLGADRPGRAKKAALMGCFQCLELVYFLISLDTLLSLLLNTSRI
jgi:hypothetical protein